MYEGLRNQGAGGMAARVAVAEQSNHYDVPMVKGSAPAPQGRLSELMATQSKLTEALHGEINILEHRLETLLRVVPTGEASGGNPRTQTSQFAAGLEEFNDRIDQAIRRIRDLASRLDI